MSKKKKVDKLVIDSMALLLRSPGKLSKADPKVSRGTGAHRSEKDYNRKREKQKLRKENPDYGRVINGLIAVS